MKRSHATAQRVMQAATRAASATEDAFVREAERLAGLMLHHQERKLAEADFVRAYVARQRARSLPMGRGV